MYEKNVSRYILLFYAKFKCDNQTFNFSSKIKLKSIYCYKVNVDKAFLNNIGTDTFRICLNFTFFKTIKEQFQKIGFQKYNLSDDI